MTTDSLRALSLAVLSAGVLVNFGSYHPAALALVLCSVPLMVASARAPRGAAERPVLVISVMVMAASGVVAGTHFGAATAAAFGVLGVVALAVLLGAVVPGRAGVAVCGAALLGSVAAGWRWGQTPVDAMWVVRDAAKDLGAGRNPYAAWFPTYLTTGLHPLNLSFIHYPYGPSLLLLALPFALLGDIRVLSAACVAVVGVALWALLRRGRAGEGRRGVVALALVFPMTAALVLTGWTADMVGLAAMAAWLVLRGRSPWAAAVILGVGLAAKPTGAATMLLPILLWSPRARRELLIAAGTAAVIILPFALWTGPRAWWDAVAGWYIAYPVRPDGLTLNSTLLLYGRGPLSAWVGLAAVAAVAALVLRRPRDLSDLLTQGAALGTVALLVAKWAYLNYYAVPAVLLLFALATRGVAVDGQAALALPRLAWRGRPRLGPARAATE